MFQPNRGKTGGGGPPQTGVPTSMQNQSCPSDMQAKEKLALYVYEYLMHSNAKGAAKLFLEEINWSNTKSIQVGDAPGFLQSWWSVFWDLYCAAPERRDTCEHSIDAKAFHDYGFVNSGTFPMVNGMHAQNAAPSPLGMAPGDGIMPPMGGGHPGYFPRPSQPGSAPSASQASPISGHPQPGFPGAGAGAPRYAPPSRGGGIRLQDPNMPPGFNGPPQHMFAGGHPDQLRPPPGMVHQQQQQQQRMPPNGPPGMRGVPTMNNFAMRPGGGAPMRWPQATPMHYGDSGAVGPYSAGPGMMSNGAMCSSTPASMMSSPGPMVPDGVAPDGRYMTMISSGPGMPPYSMVGGPDGPSGSTSDMLINGEDMKNSPASSAHGLNGGTPGPPSHQNNGAHGGGGPGSVHAGGGPVGCGPGSVHSQGNNNPNDTMDYANNPQQQGDEEQSEIAKIKQSIMEESGHFTEPKNEAADYCSYAPSL